MSGAKSGACWAPASNLQSGKRRRKAYAIFALSALAASDMALLLDEDVDAAACCQSHEINVHVVVHVRKLERVRERVDVTQDEPHRHAAATRVGR